MSWMFTRAEGFDWFVNLRATMLDDPSWFTPFGKRFVSCCGSRESGEALAAWWADSTSHWFGLVAPHAMIEPWYAKQRLSDRLALIAPPSKRITGLGQQTRPQSWSAI
jgi:hypothetical protein